MMSPFEHYEFFTEFSDWRHWADAVDVPATRASILEKIQADGFVEPFTRIHHPSDDIEITPTNLHETISAGELNARKRALLVVLEAVLTRQNKRGDAQLRILSADGISRIARILRGEYAYFLGAEYLPTEDARKAYFPVPHMDLQDIAYPDKSFDVFVSADVFEHVPNLDKALHEVYRILKPGGLLVSSFPFGPKRRDTLVKARLTASGEIEHVMEPEYHGNPVDPDGGSLVFSLPGWDILEQLREIGFVRARFDMVASARFGVLSDPTLGPLVLVAMKPANAG